MLDKTARDAAVAKVYSERTAIQDDREVEWRLKAWKAAVPRTRYATAGPRLARRVILTVVWGLVILGATFGSAKLLWLLLGVFVVAHLGVVLHHYAIEHRLFLALKHRRCPDCRHDLTAFAPPRGPECCPECAAAWPLVPPPPSPP